MAYIKSMEQNRLPQKVERKFLTTFYTYDADGNLSSDGRFNYTWNAENRLTKIEQINKLKIEFTYDYIGRRISKKTYSYNAGWILSAYTRFVYDGWNLVAEVDGTSGTVLNTYLWGEDLSGSLQGAGGVGGLLAVKNASDVFYPCYDGNGNVLAYVDSTGVKVAEYDFNPFGKAVVKTNENFKFQFSTKYHDKETGLDYYGYRYYDSDLNRWLNKDPMGETGGENLYANSGNNLVNNYDVLGLNWKIQREGKERAVACPDTADDTIKTLADKIGLEESESEKWLLDGAGKGITKANYTYTKAYTIPNTVVVSAGTGTLDKDSWLFLKSIEEQTQTFRNVARKFESGLTEDGFKVVAYYQYSGDIFVSSLSNPNVFGFMFVGHSEFASNALLSANNTEDLRDQHTFYQKMANASSSPSRTRYAVQKADAALKTATQEYQNSKIGIEKVQALASQRQYKLGYLILMSCSANQDGRWNNIHAKRAKVLLPTSLYGISDDADYIQPKGVK